MDEIISDMEKLVSDIEKVDIGGSSSSMLPAEDDSTVGTSSSHAAQVSQKGISETGFGLAKNSQLREPDSPDVGVFGDAGLGPADQNPGGLRAAVLGDGGLGPNETTKSSQVNISAPIGAHGGGNVNIIGHVDNSQHTHMHQDTHHHQQVHQEIHQHNTYQIFQGDRKTIILNKINQEMDFSEELQDYLKLPSININSSWIDNGKKLTLLHYSVQENNEEAVKTLLQHGANPNTADHEGGSPLHLAAKLGSSSIADLLLSHGAKVDRHNKFKNTPLEIAARFGEVDVARLLLQKGANVNNRMKTGWTPLHAAVTQNHEDMVHLLCQFKADLTLKASSRRIDPTGRKMTPMELAKKQGLHDMVAVLNSV